MGFWSRLFGSPPPDPAGRPASDAEPDESAIPLLVGPGAFRCPVVGESNYQDALEAICGGRTDASANEEVTAILILEDENPYDHNAVRVVVSGYTVGYLSRDFAPTFRTALREAAGGLDLRGARAKAVIRGGWDRSERGRGHYGIWLDLDVVER